MARLVLLTGVAFAVLAAASPASAGDVPKYSELPSGHLSTFPTAKPPASIPASEHVDGFFVAMPKFSPETPARARHVSVVASAKSAESIRKGDSGETDEREGATCFSDSPMNGRHDPDDEPDPESSEWSPGLRTEVNLWPKSEHNDSTGIGAVHRERLVVENGTVTLESVDAWVDPVTQGARLIGRASLPMVLVGTAVGGVKVYAARDERAGGVRFAQLVVVRPAWESRTRGGAMQGLRQDGTGAHAGGCGHLRIPLAVVANEGESAIVLAPVELPSPSAGAPAKAKANDGPPLSVKLQMLKRRRPNGKPKTAAPAPAEQPPMVEREARTRDMQIHLSVSQSSRDQDPLLAVSFGWAGREQVQRVLESAPPPSPAHGGE